jgi:hypothetical protein
MKFHSCAQQINICYSGYRFLLIIKAVLYQQMSRLHQLPHLLHHRIYFLLRIVLAKRKPDRHKIILAQGLHHMAAGIGAAATGAAARGADVVDVKIHQEKH